jgi:uncharacterized protein (DUF433 family)
MRKTVTRREQVAPNIRRFVRELPKNPELQSRLGHVHAWYAVRDPEEGWVFAPSKFVGYPDNTAKKYLATFLKVPDGGRPETVLGRWFSPVKAGTALERELAKALEDFLANWGRAPRRRARISVVTDDVAGDEGTYHIGDELLMDRISTDPFVSGGRPCIRGTRMRVSDIVDMLAHGATNAEILEDYPYLKADDIAAALAYAARAADHRVIRVA